MAIDDYLSLTGRKPGQFLFAGRGDDKRGLTTRQYARLVQEWVASIGLDPAKFGMHSLLGGLECRETSTSRVWASNHLRERLPFTSVWGSFGNPGLVLRLIFFMDEEGQ